MKHVQIFAFIFLTIIYKINSQLIWNFTIQKQSKTKLKSFLEIPSETNYDYDTVINVCFGTSPQCFDLLIHTNSFYLWVQEKNAKKSLSDQKFDYTKSSTISKSTQYSEYFIEDEKIKGVEAKDILTINGRKLCRINFLIIDKPSYFNNIAGMIGLGYMPTTSEKKFSILSQLFENNIIPHKVFSQKYKNEYHGQLTIGEIPKYIVNDYKNYGRCEAKDKETPYNKYRNNNWECQLYYIFFNKDFNNKYYFFDKAKPELNLNIIFLSYRKKTLIPVNIFSLISNIYFEKGINSGKCKEKIEEEYTFIECDNDYDPEEGSITIGFEYWEITFNKNVLFKNSEDGKTKQFLLYHKENNEKFILGRSLLKELEIVYDYANREIGFYSNNNETIKYTGKAEPKPPKIYQFLDDEKEFEAQKVNEKQNLLPMKKPEEIKIDDTEDVKDGSNITFWEKLKFVLGVVICIVIVVFVIVFFQYYMKQSNKSKVKKADKYIEERMMEDI